MKTARYYTKELLENAVKNSKNFTHLCLTLGKFPKGATYQLIKNRVKDYGIDTSHFTGKSSDRDYSKCRTRNPDQILVSGYKYRAKSSDLRRSLIAVGILYECKLCKIVTWENKKLTLHVDHIDGDWSNCEEYNLRFLCPNCHSQTSTYSNKNNIRCPGRSGDIA